MESRRGYPGPDPEKHMPGREEKGPDIDVMKRILDEVTQAEKAEKSVSKEEMELDTIMASLKEVEDLDNKELDDLVADVSKDYGLPKEQFGDLYSLELLSAESPELRLALTVLPHIEKDGAIYYSDQHLKEVRAGMKKGLEPYVSAKMIADPELLNEIHQRVNEWKMSGITDLVGSINNYVNEKKSQDLEALVA